MKFPPDTPAGGARFDGGGLRTWLSQWPALLVPGLALTAFAIKLALIARYGTATPFWDEWESLDLMAHYQAGTLTAAELLATSNEHRMTTARLVTLALFKLNGLWDPLLQMIVNAAIHAGFGAFMFKVFSRELTPLYRVLVAVVILAFVATPNANQNLLMSYQTNFYLTLTFGAVAIYLITRSTDFSLACIAGLAVLVVSFLSLTSGAFAAAACFAVIVIKLLLRVDRGWQPILLAALLVLAFAGAIAITPFQPQHANLRATSISQFLEGMVALAGWPLSRQHTLAVLVVNAPMFVLLWRTILRPAPSRDTAWFLLGLGAWSAVQFVALAETRVGGIIASRYLDFCALNVMANFICLAKMCDAGVGRTIAFAWFWVIGIGLYFQTDPQARQEMSWRRDLGIAHERNVRAFLSTGAFPEGTGHDLLTLPFPVTAVLASWLSTPQIRRILPSNLQPALAEERKRLSLPEPRDRLGWLRSGLLRSSPYLAAAGCLLLVAGILATLLQRRPREQA